MDLVEIELGGKIVSDNLQVVEVLDADADRLDRQDDLESRQARQLEFLLRVLRLIDESNSNPDIIYPLLRQHLDLLDLGIIEVLRNWVTAKFAEIDRDEQRSSASNLANFGNLLNKFPNGDWSVNIELSISCCENALKAYLKEDLPFKWARVNNNLANGYFNRTKGEKVDNLEQSILCYQSAIEILTKEDFPIEWAATQTNLGNAYLKRIKGEKADNLEQSILCYQAAIETLTKEDSAIQWATIQTNLGAVYSQRIKGDRSDNIELSIYSSQVALEVRTKEYFPIQWATTQTHLAIAYSQRIKGDCSKNIECSIQYFQNALEVLTKENLPIQWAMTQNNLAINYAERIAGDRGENLDRSIEYYKAALEVFTAESFPSEWASIQVGLSGYSIEQLQNYQIATEHLQSAYQHLLANNNNTGLLAQTMFELARCFHKTGSLGQAKLYFKDSIRLYQRLEQPTQVAAVTSALGNLELQMGQIDDARIHLQTALEFYQTAGNLDRVASIQDLQQCLPEHSPEPAI
jgi:tetratricopeptide (TPR) repeat protein